MIELESICKIQNGYILGEPDSKAGWTFFTVEVSPEMSLYLEKSGMMVGARGLRVAEQMTNFLGQFLYLRGSNVRIKKINY